MVAGARSGLPSSSGSSRRRIVSSSTPVNHCRGWGDWLVQDQRSVDGRTDVLSYQTPVLTQPVRVSGVPMADIFAKTTGTDGDFVVKVIDVYPDEVATKKEMGGFQLGSTVVLVFEAPAEKQVGGKMMGWEWAVEKGQTVKMGQALGRVVEE